MINIPSIKKGINTVSNQVYGNEIYFFMHQTFRKVNHDKREILHFTVEKILCASHKDIKEKRKNETNNIITNSDFVDLYS